MNQQLKQNKQIIRQFMRENYTDERLAMLLAHAQSGRLEYQSCCCFIGVVTADHALHGEGTHKDGGSHFIRARRLAGAEDAEWAFNAFFLWWAEGTAEEQRRRRLIPIIRAEQKRRDKLKEREEKAVCTASVGVVA